MSTFMIKFGSWTYNGYKLDLQIGERGFDISRYIPNGEWLLLGKVHTYSYIFNQYRNFLVQQKHKGTEPLVITSVVRNHTTMLNFICDYDVEHYFTDLI